MNHRTIPTPHSPSLSCHQGKNSTCQISEPISNSQNPKSSLDHHSRYPINCCLELKLEQQGGSKVRTKKVIRKTSKAYLRNKYLKAIRALSRIRRRAGQEKRSSQALNRPGAPHNTTQYILDSFTQNYDKNVLQIQMCIDFVKI